MNMPLAARKHGETSSSKARARSAATLERRPSGRGAPRPRLGGRACRRGPPPASKRLRAWVLRAGRPLHFAAAAVASTSSTATRSFCLCVVCLKAVSPLLAVVVLSLSPSSARSSRPHSGDRPRGGCSRGSRGGYPFAALGSEVWCDAIHAGVFSDGPTVSARVLFASRLLESSSLFMCLSQ